MGIPEGSDKPHCEQLADLAAALAEAETLPERAALIEKLKAEIENGTYEVDPESVSRSIVDDAVDDASSPGD